MQQSAVWGASAKPEEPVPSPFDRCPGMGWAVAGAVQHVDPCPPYGFNGAPALKVLQEIRSMAHPPETGWLPQEGSELFVWREVINRRANWMLKKLSRNSCSPSRSGVRNQLCNQFPQKCFPSALPSFMI